MNNSLLEKISIKDSFLSMIGGGRVLRLRFFLSFTAVISLVVLFMLMLFGTILLRNNYVLFMIAIIFTSFVLPTIFAALSVIKEISENNIRNVNYLKFILNKVWDSNTLQLILIYVLILVAIILGLNLLVMNIESEGVINIITIVFKIVVIFLQFISFIAIPANVFNNGQYKPFNLILKTIKAVTYNFIPCLIFFVLNVLIVLAWLVLVNILSNLLPWFLYLDLCILIIFIPWFGLSCSFLASKLFKYDMTTII